MTKPDPSPSGASAANAQGGQGTCSLCSAPRTGNSINDCSNPRCKDRLHDYRRDMLATGAAPRPAVCTFETSCNRCFWCARELADWNGFRADRLAEIAKKRAAPTSAAVTASLTAACICAYVLKCPMPGHAPKSEPEGLDALREMLIEARKSIATGKYATAATFVNDALAALASAEGASAAPNRFDCVQCGPAVKADEDGCCAQCGRDATVVRPLGAPDARLDEREAVLAERKKWSDALNGACDLRAAAEEQARVKRIADAKPTPEKQSPASGPSPDAPAEGDKARAVLRRGGR